MTALGAKDEIEVTPKMREAGLRQLPIPIQTSPEIPSSAGLLVEEIYRAMYAARESVQFDRIEEKLDRIIARLFSPEERGEEVT